LKSGEEVKKMIEGYDKFKIAEDTGAGEEGKKESNQQGGQRWKELRRKGKAEWGRAERGKYISGDREGKQTGVE